MRAYFFAISLLLGAAACGGDITHPDPDLPFGETAVVVVINPPENEGNTAEHPAFVGAAVQGVAVDVAPGGEATTDATGLAVIRNLV